MLDWNSFESVARFENLLVSLSHLALFLLLVFEVSAHVVGNRKEALEESATKEKDRQIQLLEAEQKVEKSSLHSLSAVINVKFTGDWNEEDPPFSEQYYIMPPGESYFLQFSVPNAGGMRWINFYGVRMYNFVRLAANQRLFVADLSLKPDDFLLGKPIEILKEVNGVVIYIPFVAPNKLNSPGIQISHVAIEFTINNRKKVFQEFQMNAQTFPTQIPDNRYTPVLVPLDGKTAFAN